MTGKPLFIVLEEHLYAELNKLMDVEIAESDFDNPSVRALCQLRSTFAKKFVGSATVAGQAVSSDDRRASALATWLECNALCRDMNLNFPEFKTREGQPMSSLTLDVLQRAQKWLTDVLGALDARLANPGEVACLGEIGPGSAIGSKHNDLLAKLFENRIIAPTETALYLWHVLTGSDKTLQDADRLNSHEYGPPVAIKGAAKWASAPKDCVTDRPTVTPTTLGSFLTRSLGIALEGELDRLGFSVDTQPDRQRELARLGSLDETVGQWWRPATVDSTSASDTQYMALHSYLLLGCPNIWRAICATREGVISIPVSVLGRVVALSDCGLTPLALHGLHVVDDHLIDNEDPHVKVHMTGGMGCGFTFPLQTFTYLALAIGLMDIREVPVHAYPCGFRMRMLGVFGDDVALPEVVAAEYVGILKELGMLPNEAKTYLSGPFKESCGTDWFRGLDIRGVYCKQLNSDADKVSLFNRLVDWSTTWDMPIHGTLKALLDAIPESHRNAVPLWEDVCAGIRTPKENVIVPEYTFGQRLRLNIPLGGVAYRPYRPETRHRNIAEADGEYQVEYMGYDTDHVINDKCSFVNISPCGIYETLRAGPFLQKGLVKPKYFLTRKPDAITLAYVSGAIRGDRAPIRMMNARYLPGDWATIQDWNVEPALVKQGSGGIWIHTNPSQENRQRGCQSITWSVRRRRIFRLLSELCPKGFHPST